MTDEMKNEAKDEQKVHANVLFRAGGAVAVTGIAGGVLIALGFPLIVMAYGQSLGPTLVAVFTLSGLLIGGLVALVGAFFGLVIPQQVNGGGAGPWRRHAWGHWMRHHWCGQPEGDWKNWTEQEWKDWVEKKKEQ
jgi:hypothetical protein